VEIIRLHEIGREDSASCGFKAANLGELLRLGVYVPNGFVIPVEYYRDFIEQCGLLSALERKLASKDWTAVEATANEIIYASSLSKTLTRDLSNAWTRLGASGVAVRSSATAEDLAGASFAGQYRTLLNISGGHELERAIRKCWASLWSREVLEYGERRHVDQLASQMAVVVQEMFAADAAGVLFTNDPVSERSDRILVEVVSGLGEALVSGATGGAVHRVDRASLKVVDRDGAAEALPQEQIEELCRVALDVERHFGCPQDIEFAFRDSKLALLQARPITTLGSARPEPLDPPGKPTLADRMMEPLVTERYPIAPRPLDNLIYTRLVGSAIAGLRRSGINVTSEDEAAFRAQIWRQAYRFPPHRYTWRFLAATWDTFKILRTDWSAWWENEPGPLLRRETRPVDLSQLNNSELFDRAEHLLAVWQEPLNERMFAAWAFRAELLLKLVVTFAVGKNKCAQTLASLMTGLDHPTIEVNNALWRLSRMAKSTPRVRDAIVALEPARLQSFPEGKKFLTEFDEFLEAYGHRETSCWYLSTPNWRSDPMQVWRLLGSMMNVEKPPIDREESQATYREARAAVERRLKLLPGFATLFARLLESLRNLTEFRELSHFDLTRVQAALQDIAAEWGDRLVDRRLLSSADDVFYLTYDEIRQWLSGTETATPEDAHRLVAGRRATYQLANTRWQQNRCPSDRPRSRLKGIATSPGTAHGYARLVRDERQFERLRPGEVLVCPFTTPAWTPLFASAVAVVTETGGPASHAAIVAREYGIPAVMAVPGIMQALQDDDEIVVDGESGTVFLIARQQPGQASN
jgi:pyruvate,water dikinase